MGELKPTVEGLMALVNNYGEECGALLLERQGEVMDPPSDRRKAWEAIRAYAERLAAAVAPSASAPTFRQIEEATQAADVAYMADAGKPRQGWNHYFARAIFASAPSASAAVPEGWTPEQAIRAAHVAGFAGESWVMGPEELAHLLSLAALSAAPSAPAGGGSEVATCSWYRDGDPDTDTWATECGQLFCLNEGTPTENKMHFCYHCGKPIEELPWEDEQDAALPPLPDHHPADGVDLPAGGQR